MPPSFSWERQVFLCRALAVTLGGGFLLGGSPGEAIAHLWDTVRESWAFKHDSFEPCFASLCFIVFISMWRLMDHAADRLPPGTGLRAYRIDKTSQCPPEHYDTAFGRMKEELLWYLLPLLLWDYLLPRRTLPIQAPSTAVLCGEVLGGIVAYDFLFWCWHCSCHRIPALYRIHAKHHSSTTQRSPEVVHHSFLDGSGNVGCSIAAINLVKLHPLSRAVYNAVLIYLLTELHCGFDVPWALHNLVPFRLLGGSPRHEAHHHRSTRGGRKVYMQQIFTYLDNAFGFVEDCPCPATGTDGPAGMKGTGMKGTGMNRGGKAAPAAAPADTALSEQEQQRGCR